jgi:hypothetical protein
MNSNDLEPLVVAALKSMLQKYQQIDALADQMLDHDLSTELLDAKTLQLKLEREAIEKLENESRALNQQYRASREHASPVVQQLTESLASLMQRFLMKISALEKKAKATCEHFLPQIHAGVRAVEMKKAYGKYA